MYGCVPCASLVPKEARRDSLGQELYRNGCKLPCVYAEIKPRTPGEAASALSHLAIYPAPDLPFRENISQKQRKLTNTIPD